MEAYIERDAMGRERWIERTADDTPICWACRLPTYRCACSVIDNDEMEEGRR
jgi:hypothetical protein